jgi:hypothetical protein
MVQISPTFDTLRSLKVRVSVVFKKNCSFIRWAYQVCHLIQRIELLIQKRVGQVETFLIPGQVGNINRQ